MLRQGGALPVGIDALVSAEGTNNFHDSYSPGLGAVISRTLGRHGAVYAQPMWINNTNSLPSELVDDNSTFIVGLGGRFRVRPTVYLVVEAAPRFQLNFSNGTGSTLSQVARGGFEGNDWFLGFNISRKFF